MYTKSNFDVHVECMCACVCVWVCALFVFEDKERGEKGGDREERDGSIERGRREEETGESEEKGGSKVWAGSVMEEGSW